MNQQLYYLQSISALHVGIGQGTGIIDLPIAREKASNLPPRCQGLRLKVYYVMNYATHC